jgi:hypothetical protein
MKTLLLAPLAALVVATGGCLLTSKAGVMIHNETDDELSVNACMHGGGDVCRHAARLAPKESDMLTMYEEGRFEKLPVSRFITRLEIEAPGCTAKISSTDLDSWAERLPGHRWNVRMTKQRLQSRGCTPAPPAK